MLLIKLIHFRLNLRILEIGKLQCRQVFKEVRVILLTMINKLLIFGLKMIHFVFNSMILMIRLIELTHKLEISKLRLEDSEQKSQLLIPKNQNFSKTMPITKTESISKNARISPQISPNLTTW